MSEIGMPGDVAAEAGADRAAPDPRRWLILATIGLAQLMIVLDLTVVNIALPSAQRSLHFATVDRQWVVTAYALPFGSLLLLGGRLADLLGRKVTFMAGLAGFAVVSAVGGASVSFVMLVTARACQGAFAAVMAPSALSILTNTFQDPKDRGKAFGVFGAIAGAGGAVGLLLGGALTSYLSWRWTLYVNLFFAGVALLGAAVLLRREPARGGQRLDLPGAALVGGAMFCLVYGLANAATHGWHTPSTWGFLAAGVVGLAAFAAWQTRAKQPLLPPRVVLNRNRGGCPDEPGGTVDEGQPRGLYAAGERAGHVAGAARHRWSLPHRPHAPSCQRAASRQLTRMGGPSHPPDRLPVRLADARPAATSCERVRRPTGNRMVRMPLPGGSHAGRSDLGT
jgi:MFS family permease